MSIPINKYLASTILSPEDKLAQVPPGPHVLWLMGPTSSGKTTIAAHLTSVMRQQNLTVLHYDGDEVRDLFGPGHDFSPKSRLQVVKALTYLADKAVKIGVHVVVSALTAHEEARKLVQNTVHNILPIYIDCSIEVCAQRDPKGLYKKAFSGEIDSLIGVNSPYTPPSFAKLTIDSAKFTPAESARDILDFLNGLEVKNDSESQSSEKKERA